VRHDTGFERRFRVTAAVLARLKSNALLQLLGLPKPHGIDAAVRSKSTSVRGGGIAAGSAALAGCLGGDGNSEDGTGSYTVSMAPMGEIEFDAVPEDAMVTFAHYADMAVALGHGDAVNSLHAPEMSGSTMNKFYERLEGVSFDWEGLENPLEDGVTEEELYDYDSDVHFLDPSYVLTTQDDWDESTVDGIADTIGPWVGSYHSGVHSDPAPAYDDSYEYYTLWELFEKVAAVFQERERYEALKGRLRGHDVGDRVEPAGRERAADGRTRDAGRRRVLHVQSTRPGFWQAETRPLGARDALADVEWSGDWGPSTTRRCSTRIRTSSSTSGELRRRTPLRTSARRWNRTPPVAN